MDLKAELLRKQAEFKKQRQQASDTNTIKATPIGEKVNIWSKKNKGVLERAQRDVEVKQEEENELDKSRCEYKNFQSVLLLYLYYSSKKLTLLWMILFRRKALESKSKIYEQLSQPTKTKAITGFLGIL